MTTHTHEAWQRRAPHTHRSGQIPLHFSSGIHHNMGSTKESDGSFTFFGCWHILCILLLPVQDPASRELISQRPSRCTSCFLGLLRSRNTSCPFSDSPESALRSASLLTAPQSGQGKHFSIFCCRVAHSSNLLSPCTACWPSATATFSHLLEFIVFPSALLVERHPCFWFLVFLAVGCALFFLSIHPAVRFALWFLSIHLRLGMFFVSSVGPCSWVCSCVSFDIPFIGCPSRWTASTSRWRPLGVSPYNVGTSHPVLCICCVCRMAFSA